MGNEAVTTDLPDLYTMDEGIHKYRGIELPPTYLDQVLDPFLEDMSGGKVLDLGAGTCLINPELEKRGLQGFFLDVSDQGITNAKVANPDIIAVQADSVRLPFANEEFEAVHAKDVLVHISNFAKLAEEIWRVLKPGGRVILVSEEGSQDPDHHYYVVDQKKLEEALLRQGFEEILISSWIPRREEMKHDWYRRFFKLKRMVVSRMVIFAVKPTT